jgi:hypothetical protein
MKRKIGLIAGAVPGIVGGVAKGALNLYDGTKPGLPETQGSLALTAFGPQSETLAGGAVGPAVLNTASLPVTYAGYSNFNASSAPVNPAFPILSAAGGFDLTFSAKLDNESHPGSTNRSGFSVILLGSNLSGIEIGFWTNEVFSQSTNASNPAFDFFPGETNTTFNASSGFYSYDLHIQGSNYSLTANGSQILTGSTRDYSSYPFPIPQATDPYTVPNFVFLGDDTNDAGATLELQSVAIAVPEPCMAVLLAGIGGVMLLRRRSSPSLLA